VAATGQVQAGEEELRLAKVGPRSLSWAGVPPWQRGHRLQQLELAAHQTLAQGCLPTGRLSQASALRGRTGQCQRRNYDREE
jgi:hypothetical protein